ncbi:FAD/NAD(P)-binding domain-containing protein [Hypomontagnella submonticulosa]|nr:FAD/NAD(P)-binding domain-containing protein [Hypomontagnella submonticulosa]
MAPKDFRVIVVGGGPVGLTLANTLSKAGIEYVVLERRPAVAEDVGASLVLGPHGMRPLAQLGLLDRLREISVELLEKQVSTHDGYRYYTVSNYDELKAGYGCVSHIFNRAHLVRAIYDNLSESDKPRILLNKKVTDIKADDAGVTIRCADGTTYNGSILIGADGVHSVVRKHMRAIALRQSPKIDIDDEKPFVSEYKTMWCSFPLQGDKHDGPPGTAGDSHAKDYSLQYLVGHDRAWIFVYERLPAPTRERVDYTQEDVAAFAEKWGDLAIGTKLKIRDIFPQRYHAGMSNLGEGILKRWSWGRIVLTGDAAHKFTPNPGQGFMNGIEDAVALTNELYHILHPEEQSNDEKAGTIESDINPSTGVLSAAFERFQKSRLEGVKAGLEMSATETRTSTWLKTRYWFFDWWMLPYFPKWLVTLMLKYLFRGRARYGLVLDFVEGEEPFEGKYTWINRIPNPASKKTIQKKTNSRAVPILSVLGVCGISVAVFMAKGGRYRMY